MTRSDLPEGFDELDELVARCLETLESDRTQSIDDVVAAHPERAATLRRRLERLVDMGILQRRVRVPKTIGPYRVLHPLGEGGMGVVYLAEQSAPVQRRVAIKLIKHAAELGNVVARFEAERQALALLNHEGIAKILDAGSTEDGRPYFVMERVEGEAATAFCGRHRLATADRVRLMLDVCSAVIHAHQRGILHRDLSPNNVLVAGDARRWRFTIIDFGLARITGDEGQQTPALTQAGGVLGTPEYMSPEQVVRADRPIDERADVFSLGAMLYELVAGVLPFDFVELRRQGELELLRTIVEVEPPRASARVAALGAERDDFARSCGLGGAAALARTLRSELDWITSKAMAKDLDRRYGSVEELAGDLRRYLDRMPVMAGPPTWSYRAKRFLERYRWQVGVAAGFVALLTAGLVTTSILYADAELTLSYFDTMGRLADANRFEEEERVERWAPGSGEDGQLRKWVRRCRALESTFGRRPDELLVRVRERHGARRPDGVWEYDHSRWRAFADTVGGRLPALERLLNESVPRAERRLEWAETVRMETVEARAAEWRRAAAEVTTDERFRLELEPQVGLVPLGADPDSRLQEFALVLPGLDVPLRDGAGRLRLGALSCPVLVLIPGGATTVGAQSDDRSGMHYDEGFNRLLDSPPIEFNLDPFFLGKHELSRSQWAAMLADAPLMVEAGAEPQRDLSWDDADYAARIWGLVLPTQVQWEHAARCGGGTVYPTGDDVESLQGHANLKGLEVGDGGAELPWDDGYIDPAPVYAFTPSPWGLHQMTGNVWEWCGDAGSEGEWLELRPGDGFQVFLPASDSRALWRNLRGGSCVSGPANARSVAKITEYLDTRKAIFGMRLARPLRRDG